MDEHIFADAASIPLDRAATIWPYMLDAINEFDITTTRNIAAFIAQTSHESLGYTTLREDMYYASADRLVTMFSRRFAGDDGADPTEYLRSPKKLANFVYANEGGNGDYESGDGYRYRAGGYIGITYFDGYERMEKLLAVPLIEQPQLIEGHDVAARTAAAYWVNTQWHGRNLNSYADDWDIRAISGLINRGNPHKTAAGMRDRMTRSEHALKRIQASRT